MTTGHIEVLVNDWQLLNSADSPLPFYASQCYSDTPLPKEALRARYRYLDLRREALGDNIRRRSRIAHAARCFLHDADFCEVETPILLRSTPEGAREFLVPTRGAPHTLPTFYALQQSPQQPKQLLMASGVTDRYFQFAKCFRDEDGRKDRQPEFTQIDLEMSFVSGSNQAADTAWRIGGTEVRDVTEGMVRAMWHATDLKHTPLPKDSFPTYSYAEVMQKYGSDKPDLRYGLQIADLCTAVQGDPQFALDLLVCPQYKQDNRELKLSKRQIDQLLVGKDGQPSTIEHFKADRKDSPSLASLLTRKSSHLRHIQPDCRERIDALSSALHSHLQSASIYSGTEESPALDRCDVFLARRVRDMNGGSTEMGDLRTRLAAAFAQQDSSVINANPQILWVTEFPLFTQADEEKQEAAHGRWTSSHHPFTAPALEDVGRLQEALKMSKPSKQLIASIRGQHYDLVLNGNEIAGGSVRVHDAALQEAIMRKILELSDDETNRFQHLLHALRCGFDRFMAIMCDTASIRDVIAFPKNASGADPLFASPAVIEESSAVTDREQLAPYRLQRQI
ncbi:aspartate--tRNA ligase [Malassezia psittaci]|uniref:Aspartate--tRNA ligase n=1 Tax=Malassezia psittaci TaxID=1821823 RepID=A0AAF0F295_9BASI|nr:aspartate--tRNA ligase [Malassezia psittaci]